VTPVAYWHQDGDGGWYFDWSHLWPLLLIFLYLAVSAARHVLE
jgi:hypothetical protein